MKTSDKFNFILEAKDRGEFLLFDCYPGGNDTYLIYQPNLNQTQYPLLNSRIQTLYPKFEQGGFIEKSKAGGVLRLHMAGGEFCGNAARCLAAVIVDDYLKRGRLSQIASYQHFKRVENRFNFEIEVSGAAETLVVVCIKEKDNYFVKAQMPLIDINKDLVQVKLEINERPILLSYIKMSGITHILLDEEKFGFLPKNQWRPFVKRLLQLLELESAPAIGLIWFSRTRFGMEIKPVVWVAATNTCYFESACGSGSLALAWALAKESQTRNASYNIKQPSGSIIVTKVTFEKNSCQLSQSSIEGVVQIRNSGLELKAIY